ncbi:hypothetical protein F4780DRAFT_157566 [Xylariomycetidae sp. FL0641]|nr:hypothetical protein F4780DRAFT_157566 [Xylariomycetidae sp. FL0641]
MAPHATEGTAPHADPEAPHPSPLLFCGCCPGLSYAELRRPVEVGEVGGFGGGGGGDESSSSTFFRWPLLGPLLFQNESSDARDHCANERTFLAYLRLSVYMAIVATAIVLSFHLTSQPTAVERHMSMPLGIIFWLLSVACLVIGLGNYITTVNKYSRKEAIVQSGLWTQMVMSLIAMAIIVTCIVLLIVARSDYSSKARSTQ